MKLLFFVALVCLVVWGIWRAFSSFSHNAPSQQKGGFFGSFGKAATSKDAGSAAAASGSAGKPLYDIFPEHLRSQVGMEIITDQGEYLLGRMSVHGLVKGIQDRVVEVIQPDGREGFVLADDQSVLAPSDSLGSPAPAPVRPMGASRAAVPSPPPLASGAPTPGLRGSRVGMRPQREAAPLPEIPSSLGASSGASSGGEVSQKSSSSGGSSPYPASAKIDSSPAAMRAAADHVRNARAGVNDEGSPLPPSY